MPKSDDEIRELFREGRAADRAEVPAFEPMWETAQRGERRRSRVGVALAAAALIALAGGWLAWGGDTSPPVPEQVAETNPLPDVPNSEDGDGDDELAELAAWDDGAFDAPTDFLLDERGILAGGLPQSDFDDSVLDLEDLTMEL